MHTGALAFIGILFLSVSGLIQHERISEGFINDTRVGATHPHTTAITPTSQKDLTREEFELHTKANAILQFFINLLRVIGGNMHTGKNASFLLFHTWSGVKSTLL
jgi:hypothetical protein